MASLSQVDLVGDVHNRSQAVTLQMVSLFDHPAYSREACTASRLASPQGEALKVRQDDSGEVSDRPRLVLEGAISLRLPDPAATEERLQILQQAQVSLVERQSERRPHLEACSQLRSDGQGDAEASLALR